MKTKTVSISLLSLFFVLLIGCEDNRSYNEETQFIQNWSHEYAAIKDPKLYKQKIEEIIHYFEYPEYSQKNEAMIVLKAGCLMYAYLRLFVLAQETGNSYQADIYFRKASYWHLISSEYYTRDTPKEIVQRLKKLTKKGAIKTISILEPDFVKKVEAMAKAERDKKSSGGE